MKVITTEKKPIKIWADEIEDGALQQAKNVANLPFIFKHIAIMADVHQGYGLPIGGVMATHGVVLPFCVGVDIGCGMIAAKTSIVNVDIEQIKATMGKIREAIPVGFSHHEEAQEWSGFDDAPDIPVIQKELESARKQIGTLGGGNHFIEIQQDQDDFIWLMVHSGSRHLGYEIAKVYHGVAQKMCERWYSDVPDKELSFFPIETQEAREYMEAMNYALDFAYENRRLMLNQAVACFEPVVGWDGFGTDDYINIHHNYAAWENHFGKNVLVHRKGATLARENTTGIIPGSQGTKSYIVQGRGNPDSFMSCSHGAGRRMGRKQATRELVLKDEVARLDEQGIVHGIRTVKDLDEAPGAYKDIDIVMANQADLVEIVHELRPLGVVKG